MSVKATIQTGVATGGKTYSGVRSVTADAKTEIDVSVAAAKAGSLTTRTDNTTGTITGLSGHGIATGDIVDLYWVGGSRRAVTVGTVAGLAIPLTNTGAGDNLPVQDTAMIIGVRSQVELTVAADKAQLIAVHTPVRGVVSLQNGATVHLGVTIDNNAYAWDSGSGVASPIAGDALTQVFLSHQDTAAARTMRVVVFYNT